MVDLFDLELQEEAQQGSVSIVLHVARDAGRETFPEEFLIPNDWLTGGTDAVFVFDKELYHKE